jgi:hypothetical protein
VDRIELETGNAGGWRMFEAMRIVEQGKRIATRLGDFLNER